MTRVVLSWTPPHDIHRPSKLGPDTLNIHPPRSTIHIGIPLAGLALLTMPRLAVAGVAVEAGRLDSLVPLERVIAVAVPGMGQVLRVGVDVAGHARQRVVVVLVDAGGPLALQVAVVPELREVAVVGADGAVGVGLDVAGGVDAGEGLAGGGEEDEELGDGGHGCLCGLDVGDVE